MSFQRSMDSNDADCVLIQQATLRFSNVARSIGPGKVFYTTLLHFPMVLCMHTAFNWMSRMHYTNEWYRV